MKWPRPTIVLAVTLGGAVILVTMMVTRGGPTSAATSRTTPSRAPAASERATQIPVTDLKLERLEQTRADLAEPARNPFRFRPRAAPQAPRPAPTTPALAAAPPRPAAPPPPTGPPPIQLRFIGLFDAPGQAGRVAIMSDGRGNVFQGKEGDIIEGRYRVGRVATDSLELSYVDGRGRQVIRLSGQ
jgi:hypothetical protein